MSNNMKIELKNFLRLRGLKVTGKKEILVARAFCAIENNVTLVKTAQEVEVEVKRCLRNLVGQKKKLIRGGSRTSITSKVEFIVTIVNRFQPLTIIIKSSILDLGGILFPPLLMIYPC